MLQIITKKVNQISLAQVAFLLNLIFLVQSMEASKFHTYTPQKRKDYENLCLKGANQYISPNIFLVSCLDVLKKIQSNYTYYSDMI